MSDHSPSPIARMINFAIIFCPAALLGALALRYESLILTIGAAVSLFGLLLFFRPGLAWKPPVSGQVILLYLIALGFCWIQTRDVKEPPAAFGRGVLLLVPVVLLFAHELSRSGAEQRRQARLHTQRLRKRQNWPVDLTQIPRLPEVKALRNALINDASPVFGLFNDPDANVRMAAFASLEGRKVWRAAEIAVVLHKLHQMNEPAVRAMAITALEQANEPSNILELSKYLRDPEPSVRLAALRAVLSNPGNRWGIVRESVRLYLSDPRFTNDGGLACSNQRLPAVAVCDLTAWAMEPEPLASRSIRSLMEYYAQHLQGEIDYDLVSDMSQQVVDIKTPAGLRVEIAHLLRSFRLLTPDLLDRMTNSDQPGPVRLMAAEAMLSMNPSDPDALDVLRGLGRQPNRELAIGVAKVLQNHLGFEMGIPADRFALKSKTAAEIVKKVQQWATARSMNNISNPTPGFAVPGLPDDSPPIEMTRADSVDPASPSIARRSWRQ